MRTPENFNSIEQLIPDVWNRGEICILFSPTNVGKTIFGMQYATEIAKAHPTETILYFDFELSERQIVHRYFDEESKIITQFPQTCGGQA